MEFKKILLTKLTLQERFADLSEAYNVLSDPVKREEYFKEVLSLIFLSAQNDLQKPCLCKLGRANHDLAFITLLPLRYRVEMLDGDGMRRQQSAMLQITSGMGTKCCFK
jgi:curved DNA-binding protein CbpA